MSLRAGNCAQPDSATAPDRETAAPQRGQLDWAASTGLPHQAHLALALCEVGAGGGWEGIGGACGAAEVRFTGEPQLTQKLPLSGIWVPQ